MKTTKSPFYYQNIHQRKALIFIIAVGAILFVLRYFMLVLPSISMELPKVNVLESGQTKENIFENYDVNTINEVQLIEIGLRPFVAKRFIRFRKMIKGFSNQEEVLKVFGLNEQEMEVLSKLNFNVKLRTVQTEVGGKFTFLDNERNQSKYREGMKKLRLRKFNPNVVSREELLDMNLPINIVNNIINFRSKGFHYGTKEDLLKLYTMNSDIFKELSDYIVFSPVTKEKTELSDNIKEIPKDNEDFYHENRIKNSKKKNSDFTIKDINAACAEDLKRLPGIGEFYANKIIKFRDALGGFICVEQVGETSRLPDSTFSKILPFLNIETVPKVINLNEVTYVDLAKHPYITSKEASIIINYRKQHGRFNNIIELLKIDILNEKWLNKVKPYLAI